MALITREFFIGDIDLPGRDNTGPEEGLTDFINKYEPEFITRVFGYSFGKLFYNEVSGSTPSQRMKDIRDGKEFTVDEVTYKWLGLIQTIASDFKISPIANYVYLQWRRSEATSTGNVGENKPQTANATQQSAVDKTVFARKEMADRIRELYCFLQASKVVYPEWDIDQVDCYMVEYSNSFGI